jgi:1,4-dihydroxy-2-naphthoate octaprenyltransferase
MRYTIMRRPVWQRSVLIGVVYAATIALVSGLILDYESGPAVVGSLVGGVIFVIGITLAIARAEKALNPVAGPPLTPDERVQAVRAVDHGQSSGNPRVQMAAVTLARQRVRQRRGIILLAVLFGFSALVAAAFAVVENPWWWLLAAIIVVTGPPFIAELRRQHKGATKLLAAAEKGAAGQ